MAGGNILDDALNRPYEGGSLASRYNPARQTEPEEEDLYQPDPIEEIEQLKRFTEATKLLGSDFAMELPDEQSALAEPSADYQPPETLQQAEEMIAFALSQLEKRRAELDGFVSDTKAIIPLDDPSAKEVIRRANVIARARRDVANTSASLEQAKLELAQVKQAQTEDPAWWQEALNWGAEKLGFLKPVVEFLSGPQESAAGWASIPAEMLSSDKYGKLDVGDLATIPLSLFDTDHALRKRGRAFTKSVARNITALEEVVIDTPVLGELYKFGPGAPMYWGAKAGAAVLGTNESKLRELRNEIAYSIITDPLNVIDVAGPITKLGKLRQLAKVNEGAMDLAARLKTLDEIAELAKLPNAEETIKAGTLVTDLRAAGVSGEEAADIASRYDNLFRGNLKELRTLASENPLEFASAVRPWIEGAKPTKGRAAMFAALDRIGEFGQPGENFVDPIIGRTFREQAALGQRAAAWNSVIQKFGDRPWFRAPSRMWARLTGDSLKADIADNPDLIEVYYAQRMFKADAGSEFMRYQQDVTKKAAAILNKLDAEQQKAVQEALPRIVEHTTKEGRAGLREGLDSPLKMAMVDLADLYDESAETLRAIQNRFNLDVADFAGDFSYFGREFGEQLKDILLKNPKARAILFGETTRRSREFLSASILPEANKRILREEDFFQSEEVLRQKFAKAGINIPKDTPIWSRDAFGNLAKRADRARRQANIRNLYGEFVEVFGRAAPEAVTATRQAVNDLIGKEQARLADEVAKARAAADAAPTTPSAGGPTDAEVEALRTKSNRINDNYMKDVRPEEDRLHKLWLDAKFALDDAKEAAGKTSFIGPRPVSDKLAQAQVHFDKIDATYKKLKAVGSAMLKARDRANDEYVNARELLLALKGKPGKPGTPDPAAMKALEAAEKAALKGDPNNWSGNAKAEWLMGRREFRPSGQNMNGLEVLKGAKLPMPESWDELARLAATEFTPKQAEEFARINDVLNHVDTPNKWLKATDAIKAIYQRSTLARVASLTRDLFGTTINMAMEGSADYLPRALRELGKFNKWQEGGGSALVHRLRAQEVLRTTKGEALEKGGTLEAVFGKRAGLIEEHGVVGGTLANLGAPQTGKAIGRGLGKINDARVYWEEAGRIATYLKRLDQGYSAKEAVEEVYKWWGKFDELSKLEKNVLNRIMFFWSWQARSIPITIRHILEHPVRSRLLLTMMAGDVTDNENMPPWLRRMGGWMLGRRENGQIDAINVGGSTYFSPTMSMLQGQFANEILHGKPMNAIGGALLDTARSMPPYMQAPIEAALKYDLFTEKDWWRNQNAETGSNMKAPTALWIFKDTAFGDALGLREDTRTGTLKISPTASWVFGALPGVEPAMTDVSAFFRTPKAEGELPELDLTKGFFRVGGIPVYTVDPEEGKSTLRELKAALAQSANKVAGNSLADEHGRVFVAINTFKGQEIRAWQERVKNNYRAQGMTAAQAQNAMMDAMKGVYPTEWKMLTMQARLDRWEQWILSLEKGEAELNKQEQELVGLAIRRADASRVERFERAEERKKLAKLLTK